MSDLSPDDDSGAEYPANYVQSDHELQMQRQLSQGFQVINNQGEQMINISIQKRDG